MVVPWVSLLRFLGALLTMATRCASDVAAHEQFSPAAKELQSMTLHWSGLTVFANSAWVDIDNSVAERTICGPAVGRQNFCGSGSEGSAKLAATMHRTLATMKLWGLRARTWLAQYLQACVDNDNRPPDDITALLSWQMSVKRLAVGAD